MLIAILLFILFVFIMAGNTLNNIPGMLVGFIAWFGNLPGKDAAILIIIIFATVKFLPMLIKKIK